MMGNTLTMRRLGQQWPKEWKEDPKTNAIVWSLPQLKEPNVNDQEDENMITRWKRWKGACSNKKINTRMTKNMKWRS
jgi:seryl-tRNA synthetase